MLQKSLLQLSQRDGIGCLSSAHLAEKLENCTESNVVLYGTKVYDLIFLFFGFDHDSCPAMI